MKKTKNINWPVLIFYLIAFPFCVALMYLLFSWDWKIAMAIYTLPLMIGSLVLS